MSWRRSNRDARNRRRSNRDARNRRRSYSVLYHNVSTPPTEASTWVGGGATETPETGGGATVCYIIMFLLRPQKRQHELEAEQQRRQKAEADQRADDNFRLWLSTKARLTRETKQRDKDRKVRVTQKTIHLFKLCFNCTSFVLMLTVLHS